MFSIKNFVGRAIVSLGIFLFFSVNALAVDWYVSATGSNGNSGTSEVTPFLTINQAIGQAQAGDTIYVMDGTYQNNNYGSGATQNNGPVATVNISGDATNGPITLKNLGGHSPKIQFDGAGGIKIDNNINYVIVEGFEVEGPSASINYAAAKAERDTQVAEWQSSGNVVKKNYFQGKGIWGWGPHNNVIVRNNVVHDTPGSGIRFNDSDHMIIENNVVFNATWWSSSAESAIVFAETIAAGGDNGSEIKMIMRKNVVYNSWNRMPFFSPSAGGLGGFPDYGEATQDYILDGQGLYVTRSDTNYAGTFLFENNICVNNGKNGINFDQSDSASAIYSHNTLYYNGVHNIIQQEAVTNGEQPAVHDGPNLVAGIKARNVDTAIVANNNVVTRDSLYSALADQNTQTMTAVNNIFLNGTVPAAFTTGNLFIDPNFVNATIDMTLADFRLDSGSPAISAANFDYAAVDDIDGVIRPDVSGILSAASFEGGLDGWTQWGATLALDNTEAYAGGGSLKVSNRTANYMSARLYVNGLLTPGATYTLSVWVKLAAGESGTAGISYRITDDNGASFGNPVQNVPVSDSGWTQLSANYTHNPVGTEQEMFFYIKGPNQTEGWGDYFMDAFSLTPAGVPPLDFGDLPDIGAYEFVSLLPEENVPLPQIVISVLFALFLYRVITVRRNL